MPQCSKFNVLEFKPNFYRRFVDDIFVLFESPASAHSFCKYIASEYQTINFTVTLENIGSHFRF